MITDIKERFPLLCKLHGDALLALRAAEDHHGVGSSEQQFQLGRFNMAADILRDVRELIEAELDCLLTAEYGPSIS